WQDYPAYGPSTEAAAGLNALMGGPNDPPMRVGSGVFSDQTGGRYAALAIIAALEQRQRTGEGRTLDLSMTEGIAHLLGEKLLAAARTGENPPRTGNRDQRHAPQGIYPCAGADAWLALSVQTDAQWRSLRELLDDPALCAAAYELAAGRLAQQDELDIRIAAWTRRYTKEDAATLLQARGIPAAPVQQTGDLPLDEQLRARGAFQPVERSAPLLGHTAHPQLTLAWQIEGTARPPLQAEHPTGADNRRVLKRWLGLSAAETRRLEQAGALIRTRPSAISVPPAHRGATDPTFPQKLKLPAAAIEGNADTCASST
ncbi:MAG: CoA transferase, partial [Dehalococcoidia bacterium]